MTHKHITEQKIKAAISKSHSMREASQILKIPYETFIWRAKKLGVYNPTPNKKGFDEISPSRKAFLERSCIKLTEILEGKHPTYHACGGQFKERLYRAGIKTERCENCGQGPRWKGKPLTLELEHIDGNRNNHRLENLKILCPHCHSQTPTYRKKKSALNKSIK